MEQTIKHQALIKQVDGQRVIVTIVQASACTGCAARRMCNSAEAKEKDVEVHTAAGEDYEVGQEVILEGHLSDGRKAALIAYGVPLLLLLAATFVGISLTGSDTAGALCALGVVLLYYVCLYLFFRQRLQQQFSFTIHSRR